MPATEEEGASGEKVETTEVAGAVAAWVLRDRVIHVVAVRYPDGAEVVFDDEPMLGACLGQIPRTIWDALRREAGL